VAGLGRCPGNGLAPSDNRGRIVGLGVANAQTAAQVELARGEPKGRGLLQALDQHRCQIPVRLQLEDLGADVGVNAFAIELGGGGDEAVNGLQLTGIEAEFAIEVAGTDVVVRVALNAGRHAQQQRDGRAAIAGELGQLVQFLPVVGYHGGPGVQRLLELGAGFVVAVQVDAPRLQTRLQGRMQLAAGGNVNAQAFLGHQAGDRQTAPGFGGIENLRLAWIVLRQAVAVLAASFPQRTLVQDVERRSELLHQRSHLATANLEAIARVGPRC